MDAIAAGLGGKVRAVVHQDGDVALLGDRPQDLGGAANFIVGGVFKPQLQAGDVARVERCGKGIAERRRIERRRRDQVKPAAVAA
jgi:hypothetical protein